MNILITGSPGIGKTTLIKKTLALYTGLAVGFYTEEIREVGRRRGFKVNVISNTGDFKEGILAHDEFPSPIKVSKYGVNIEEFERVGVSSIERVSDDNYLIVIDEIGKMELYSGKFRRAVKDALDSPNPVLATIGRIKNGFVEEVKARRDVIIFELTYENRDEMPRKVVEILERGI